MDNKKRQKLLNQILLPLNEEKLSPLDCVCLIEDMLALTILSTLRQVQHPDGVTNEDFKKISRNIISSFNNHVFEMIDNSIDSGLVEKCDETIN
jgi:hypothetical protein